MLASLGRGRSFRFARAAPFAWAAGAFNASHPHAVEREFYGSFVEFRSDGHPLPFTVFEEQRRVAQGDIVANERLGTVLATIRVDQRRRDEEALASPRVRNRTKERIRKVRNQA